MPSPPDEASRVVASVLWRRLDTPGHDCCRLEERDDGWRLEGTAVFRHEATPARLTYVVACDRAWRTVRGDVRGWLGARAIELTIARAKGGPWTLDGAAVPGLESYVDLDLDFTPATNLLQLRRIALADGQAADVPVAWLDVSVGTLTALPQRYERRSESTYWYESPSAGYEGLLEVDATGFIRRYPGLWESES
ncbi:MAG TPA: putative glycolipid-binding domain-containing protein [Gemmatimonadaceae bacterium]|nr:putative glycolipid-binding domain-containing protein [Gemmatimonadaceae bacterium]